MSNSKKSSNTTAVAIVENAALAPAPVEAPVPALDPLAALNALFASVAGLSSVSETKAEKREAKKLAYRNKTLTSSADTSSVNLQHSSWSELYQAQRTAAVRLGMYRTSVMGLPKGCRKFDHGKFKTTLVWNDIEPTIPADSLATYYEMEKAIEAIC